jgi:hypothetical protein
MALGDGHTLLVGFKRRNSNRRDRDQFDFLLEAYIKDETSNHLIWYWKSSTDAWFALGKGSEVWEQMTASSDLDEVNRYLKAAIEHYLLPAARHEVNDPTAPSIGGTRIGPPD